MKILIVEDQENLAKLIKDGLESEGFSAEYVLDGETAQTRIEISHNEYDLILMDIMIPKKNGIEVCLACRKKNITTPIIMLTAKDSPDDIINGLNAGADDYLVKPFSFDILAARIRAILRRPTNLISPVLKVKNIVLDPNNKKVVKGKTEIKLTMKEFSILEHLMRHQNQVINREQIISNIWDFSDDSFSNIVDVHMTNLRKKLENEKNEIIETVHGVGFRINS